jgi:hypothetical protein
MLVNEAIVPYSRARKAEGKEKTSVAGREKTGETIPVIKRRKLAAVHINQSRKEAEDILAK